MGVVLENVNVMLQVKCHQYWPEVGSMNMGDLTISLIEIQELAYYTIRTFHLSKVNNNNNNNNSTNKAGLGL